MREVTGVARRRRCDREIANVGVPGVRDRTRGDEGARARVGTGEMEVHAEVDALAGWPDAASGAMTAAAAPATTTPAMATRRLSLRIIDCSLLRLNQAAAAVYAREEGKTLVFDDRCGRSP